MSSVAAAVGGAVTAALPAPYLAGLTLTVPDRRDGRWYRPTRSSAARVAVVAGVAAAFGALAGAAAGPTAAWPAWVALAVVLAPLAIIDGQHHRLPDRLIGAGYLLGVALLALAAVLDQDGGRLLRAGLCGVGAFTAFAVLHLTSRRALGFGDVTLAGLLGLYLGWLGVGPVALGLYAGFVLGAVAAIALLIARRAGWREEFAFGPPLMLGALLVAALS
ncbi:MAG: prepilin peptidase [bacterium]